jgi:inorganic pyrophosphatase
LEVRPIGLFWMHDEKGPDAKLLCVLADDPRWEETENIDDLPKHLLDEISHFFEVYKALEPDTVGPPLSGVAADLEPVSRPS